MQNGSQLAQNGSPLVRNRSQLVRNGSQLVRNESQLVRNGSQSVRNGSQFIRNRSQFVWNGSQLFRNMEPQRSLDPSAWRIVVIISICIHLGASLSTPRARPDPASRGERPAHLTTPPALRPALRPAHLTAPRAPSRKAYAMSSSKRAGDELEDEIEARQQLLLERQVALDAREARLLALEADMDGREEVVAEVRRSKEEEPQPDRTRSEAVAAGKQPRLQYVARDLLHAHDKDAVIIIINKLREAFAPTMKLTELQEFGGESLVDALVQIAAESDVDPAELQEINARVTRSCEE